MEDTSKGTKTPSAEGVATVAPKRRIRGRRARALAAAQALGAQATPLSYRQLHSAQRQVRRVKKAMAEGAAAVARYERVRAAEAAVEKATAKVEHLAALAALRRRQAQEAAEEAARLTASAAARRREASAAAAVAAALKRDGDTASVASSTTLLSWPEPVE